MLPGGSHPSGRFPRFRRVGRKKLVEKVGRKNVGNGSMSVLKVSVPNRNASLNGDSSNKNTGASPEDVWDFAQGACASGALGLAPDETEVCRVRPKCAG